MSLQFRRDSEANITQFNPVLKEGEPLWDLDNKKLYIGDGVTNAVQLDSITGVTDSEVATVLNSLLTEGSSPNVNFVYDTGEDVFNISLDFAIPFDQEIRSTAGFVGSLIGDDSSTVFEASESAFVNLSEAFLTDIGPRTDQTFNLGSDEKRFNTAFVHNINVKDQTVVEDLNINGLIKSEDSSVLFDSRTNTLSASIIVGNLTGNITGNLTGSIFANDTTVLVDHINNVLSNGVLSITDKILSSNSPDIEFAASGGLYKYACVGSQPDLAEELGDSIVAASGSFTGIDLIATPPDLSSSFVAGDITSTLKFVAFDLTRSYPSVVLGTRIDKTAFTESYAPSKFFLMLFPETDAAVPVGQSVEDTIRYVTYDPYGRFGVGREHAKATLDINGFMKLKVLSTEPTVVEDASIPDGFVAIADGVNWDPLSNGRQSMVVRLGGTWVQMAVAP